MSSPDPNLIIDVTQDQPYQTVCLPVVCPHNLPPHPSRQQHLTPVSSVWWHFAPFWQGLGWQCPLLLSQCFPVNPLLQRQLHCFSSPNTVTHSPPFLQGEPPQGCLEHSPTPWEETRRGSALDTRLTGWILNLRSMTQPSSPLVTLLSLLGTPPIYE